MTTEEIKQQYPGMPEEQVNRLVEIEKAQASGEFKLCKIDETDCESCQ